MFRLFAHSKRRQPSARLRRRSARPLCGESLEARLTLDGTVQVTLAGTTLLIDGDTDANDVLIREGANPNEILIEGKNRDGVVTTQIVGPALIRNPVDQIRVALFGGSDDFRIEGHSPQDRFVVRGELNITNYDGNNVNRLENVVLTSTLLVHKVAGYGESTLEIIATDVVGEAVIANHSAIEEDAADAGPGGPTKLLVAGGSTFQSDVSISNGDGQDILVVDRSNFDGDLVISNGDGDTRTIFGMSEDPIVWGDLVMANGDGNDTFVLHDTDVWGTVVVSNGDGHTDTVLDDARVGLGEPVAAGSGVLVMQNGAGRDTFLMKDSTVMDDVVIDTASNNADTFGSVFDFSNSQIRGAFVMQSDDGFDHVGFEQTTVGREFVVDLQNGSSHTMLVDSTIGLEFVLAAGFGSDTLIFERSDVLSYTTISLGEGVDRLEVLDASRLVGEATLVGGDGIDTFVRQTGPSGLAVDILFLVYEDFELDQFVV